MATREDARRHAEAIGYPLILKARSGGGGRGIRKVFDPDELEDALERTQGEAERSFGDPVVFMERLVTDARHVEVQVIADNYGNVWAPGVRDCSIQRRNQKVIEESSSPLLTKEQADQLRTVSAELVRAAGTAAPAPSSSSTSRSRRCSRSSRSTPGCRSSTRSPRSPPASTW